MATKMARFEIQPDDRGLGFDMGFGITGTFHGQVCVGIFGDFMEARRFLTLGELEDIRDWIADAILILRAERDAAITRRAENARLNT